MFDTIVALASAPIKSALAIIRLSGDNVYDIVNPIFTKELKHKNEKELLYGYIVDKEKKVDQVVLLKYDSPASFTGENVVEIITHGSMLIVREIIDLCLKRGARLADPGEFTFRAFLNGKIDLIQAEAINDLINATTKESQELSLYALEGKTSKEFLPLKVKLADLLSNIEVNIDYPEYEDIEKVNKEKVIKVTEELNKELDKILVNAKNAIKIKDGLNVVIVGKPNVGKSSLLNALIKQEKAIVTEIEGTTRDIVEGKFNLGPVPIYLFDTAGIRDTKNIVEKIGIKKTNEIVKKADLILYVTDDESVDSKTIKSFKNKPYIIVNNKADLLKKKKKDEVYVTASKQEVDSLLTRMKEILNIEENIDLVPSFTNARQIGLLENIRLCLEEAKKDASNDLPIDIVSINLLKAYNDALDLLGEGNKNDLSEEIFSRFCVGK